MAYVLLKDAPRGWRRALLIAALALACFVLGGGGGYALRALVSPRRASPRPVFLLVGDSLTQWGANVTNQGWVSRLQTDYARSADIINRGIAGDTTRNFIHGALPGQRDELSGWLQPSLITLWLGANDAADEAGRHGWLHVPVDEYQKNLARIIKDLMWLAPTAKILVLTPPIVDAEMRRDTQEQEGAAREPPDRTNEATATYVKACLEVGNAFRGVATLDVYGKLMAAYPNATERAARLLMDGLHLTAEGNAAVYRLVDEQIRTLLTEFATRTGPDP